VDDEPAEDDISPDAIPCDTLAATLLLRSQFPNTTNKDALPFALRSQLYTIVNDRTIVDRELDMLRYRTIIHPCLPQESMQLRVSSLPCLFGRDPVLQCSTLVQIAWYAQVEAICASFCLATRF